MAEKNFVLYKHTCPNGKIYIGITCNKLYRRWQNGKGYHHNKHFTNAINKYGWENIKHEVLFENLTKEEAEQKEIELIAKYDLTNRKKGYNCDNGGLLGSYGHKVDENARKKISKANKGRKAWNKGIPMSKETKEKLSESLKKRNIKGVNNPFYNHKHTEETKKKISDIHKGKIPYNKGIPMKQESKEKMSKPVICVETNTIYYSLSEASRKTKIFVGNISKCCNGIRKTAGGYIWRYANENNCTFMR